MKKIPTYLLHGPLGSGKTTILKCILSDPGFRNSIVIENEYANYNIDKNLLDDGSQEIKIMDVSGGCICCTSGKDLFETFQSITKEKDVEQVFIETTGVASSVQLIKQMMLSREFDEHFSLVKNILVIDCLEESVEVLKAEKMLDLIMADLVILHKVDLVNKEKLIGLRSFLENIPELTYTETSHGEIDPKEIVSKEKSKALDTLLGHLDELSGAIDHSKDVLYQVIYPKKTIKQEELMQSIQEAQKSGALIRRAKGTFTTPEGKQFSLNGTTHDLKITSENKQKTEEDVLVFIGKNVTKETIQPLIHALC